MLIIAHRGCYSRQVSENTLEAFQAAVQLDVQGVEFDLRLAKDGEIVAVHDPDLRRIAGTTHRIEELDSDELAKVALRYGGKIPTLNEVTAHIHAPMLLDMEVKSRKVVEPLLVKLGTSSSLRERTIVSSFNSYILKEVQSAFPDVRTMYLIGRWPLPLRRAATWKRLKALAPWAVAMPIVSLTPRRVQFLNRMCQRVGGWDLRGLIQEYRRAEALDLDIAVVKPRCPKEAE